jgi:hypothetical protein
MDRVDYQTLIIQDLININKSLELELSPWYQRRSIWTPAQKSYLINTLFEQKPIPAIYIRHSLDLEKSKSIKEIVDGQQRTRAILSYCADDFGATHPSYNRRVKFSALTRDQQQKFLLTAIPVGYLLGATDADVIDIFGRINSVSKSLNPQEKRNAAYSGEMKQFCLKQASSRVAFWRNYGVLSANDIARMQEVQFVSDIIFNLMNGLSDYSSTKIDDFYKEFDEEFDRKAEITDRLDRVFDIVASLDRERISDTIFKRQPVFFSLIILLDSLQNVDRNKLDRAINEIDERYNSDNFKTAEDSDFIAACSASTQRISQRTIRNNYIKSFL